MNADFLFFLALTVAIIFSQLSLHMASPVMSIANRWIRWMVFSLCGAKLVMDFELTDSSYWSISLAMILLWLLLETIYNWFMIKMLSMSRIPLFPKYSSASENWPENGKFPKLAAWLKKNGYRQIQALKTQVIPGMGILSLVYQNESSDIRLQITFIPQFRGKLVPCLAFSSNMTSGEHCVTDNYYIPFGGYYPEHWNLLRKPWCRSADALLRKHQRRIAGKIVTPWVSEPLLDANRNQQELEQVNMKRGFLVDYSQREEYGTITSSGRYRVWKEYWLLNYLGLTVDY